MLAVANFIFGYYLFVICLLFNQNEIRNWSNMDSFLITIITRAFSPRSASLCYLRIAGFFFG